MSAFEYTVLDKKGHEKKGVLEGDTPKHIRQILRDQGMVPLTVSPVSNQPEKSTGIKVGSSQRMGPLELALVTRQLSALLQSGLPLEEVLKSVAAQNNKSHVKKVLLSIRSKVREGHSLASGMADFPKVFPELYHKTVQAGEATGHLDIILERLADYAETRHRIKQRTTLALFYPALMTVVSIAIVLALLTYVVPEVVKVFDSADKKLPVTTEIVISISNFFKQYYLLLAATIAIAVVSFRAMLHQPLTRAAWHRFILTLPLIGHLTRTTNTARFAKTLSILTASNVPILEALRISGEVLTNLPMRYAVEKATVKVREGASLFNALSQSGYFPPMTLSLISSGEASGKLESMLERSAEIQEREVESTITTLLGLFEPILILVMGAFVLIIVIALLLPIFDLTTLVG